MSKNCQLCQPRFSPWENWKSYILLLSRFYKLFFTFFPRIPVSIKISSLNSFWPWRKEHGKMRGMCSINMYFYRIKNIDFIWKNRHWLSTQLLSKCLFFDKVNTIWIWKRGSLNTSVEDLYSQKIRISHFIMLKFSSQEGKYWFWMCVHLIAQPHLTESQEW